MEGGDVSLAIRRARRAGAKSLDLSNRGLRNWPEGLFALRQLETLNVSGNELSVVDNGITQLENLEELDLSNNRLQSLSEIEAAAAGLQQLRSLVVDGNPVASQLPPATLHQLSRPSVQPGLSFAQVIRNTLQQAASEKATKAPPPPPKEVARGPAPGSEDVVPFGVGADDDDDDEGDYVPEPRPNAPRPAAAAADRALAGGGGDASAPAWRSEQSNMLKEIERLRGRVRELEEAQDSPPPGRARGGGGGGSDGRPAWLQQDSRVSLASTLPSRRGGLTNDDEAAELRNQLKEEQRRCKRLEKEVQRLTDRAQERAMSGGGTGSVPHFEWSKEVEVGEILNQGGFSVVHKGFWHGTKVAIKKLFDPNITEELLAEFDNEVQKLEQIRHPHILMLLAVHRKPPALSMIMELVEGGSLYQLLHTPSKFNSATGPIAEATLQQSLDILEVTGGAIAFLHARGIAHRDIKSQNVLLSPSLDVKLCDFGLARMRSELMTGSMQFAGTPNYMAPEIFRNQRYTENVDVFAFGTMLWEAAAGDIPWANMDPPDIRARVLEGQMLPIPRSAPYELHGLIQDCWTADRNTRPPMAAVVAQLRVCPREGGGGSRPRRSAAGGAGALGTSTRIAATPTAF